MLEYITEKDQNESDDGNDDRRTLMIISWNPFERVISTSIAISHAFEISNVRIDALHEYEQTLDFRMSIFCDVPTRFDSTQEMCDKFVFNKLVHGKMKIY